MNARRVETTVVPTAIVPTQMEAGNALVWLGLMEVPVRFKNHGGKVTSYFLASGCTDVNECLHPNGVNVSYVKPTFRNLPGDDLLPTTTIYNPTPCSSTESCVNIFYTNGMGFKCMDSSLTKSVWVISGYYKIYAVDVLKADLSRCDARLPVFPYNAYYHKVINH